MIKRIAITGPESTGKTWLAEKLASHYKTIWVPEFARNFINNLKRPYTSGDILHIARNQYRLNAQAESEANQFLFCDTELLVTKIWSEVKFGKCHPWIDEHINSQHFDIYLVPDIDLPWEPDPLREHPHMRNKLMELYLKELEKNRFAYRIINGLKEERFVNSLKAIADIQ